MTPPDLVVRVAGERDAGAIASLRKLWLGGAEPGFERRMADWLTAEGDRRTTFLATLGGTPAGMASLFEYRRMPKPGRPDSSWGYVSNVFVREERRGRGVGTALLSAVVAAADERGYVRLVLSPSDSGLPLFRRLGFVVADESAGGERLLVRPRPSR